MSYASSFAEVTGNFLSPFPQFISRDGYTRSTFQSVQAFFEFILFPHNETDCLCYRVWEFTMFQGW